MMLRGSPYSPRKVLARSSFAERFADLVLKYLLPGGVRIEEEEHELPEE